MRDNGNQCRIQKRFWLPLVVLLLFVSRADPSPPEKASAESENYAHYQKTQLVAVIHQDSPPTFFRDPETGKASGFEVDVVNKIAKRSGLSITYIFGQDWNDMIRKVLIGEADLIAGLGATPKRLKKLAYTETLDSFPVSLFTRTGSSIKGLRNGLKVGVPQGSVSHEYLSKQKKLIIKRYDSYKAGLFDLLAGRIDAFCCPQPTFIALAHEAGVDDKIKIAGPPITEIKRAIAVRKNNSRLLKILNTGVSNFVGTPEYQDIYRKWYGKPSSYWTHKKIMVLMGSGTLLVIVLMALWRYISMFKLNRKLLNSISELKAAEQNRIRLETAIISAAEAIVLTDARGIIQYVNPAFERLTGFTKDEAVGRDLHILDSGKQDASYYREMREALQRDGVWTGRLVNKKKDNSYYQEECTYSSVKEPDGTIINYVCIKRDITEKLRLESVAAALDSMNNIGYIFSGVRHEIGNPVNSVRLLLGLVKQKLPDLDKPAVETYIDRSLTQLSKLDYLLNTLRNFNMYEKIVIQQINVREFFGKFISLVKEDFTSKGIKVGIRIEPGVDTILADPRALHQVLMNILANASDALQATKYPKISVAIFRLHNGIGIRIKDNGQGMTEEEQKHLFTPFYTTKSHGTGLGMVIVKRMLSNMNSSIEVRSSKGKGTTVEILLPLSRTTVKPEAYPQPPGTVAGVPVSC